MENAHDIAIELEHMLCDEFGFTERPMGTIFDADAIETRSFYDVIYLLLYKNANGEWDEFAYSILQYKCMNMNEIPNYKEIFDRFKALIS